MPKTKEQIAAYNREYFARPEVKARAKIRNAQRRHVRIAYKKTPAGIEAERRYRQGEVHKVSAERSRLKTRYGITLEQYLEMHKKQNGACAICLVVQEKLHIDHCHKTDIVRGLLCGKCNRGLGMFSDDTLLLRSAMDYLNGVH